MLSYNDQYRMRSKRGSGDKRIEKSVGDFACVCISPRASASKSFLSGGFKRRTSSRRIARTRSPLSAIQLEELPDVDIADIPNPLEVFPDSSKLEVPTIASQRESLSSRPSSESNEYMIDEIGSEYDVPRL